MNLQLCVLLGSAAAVIMASSGLWASGTVLLLFNTAALAYIPTQTPPFHPEGRYSELKAAGRTAGS